MTKYIVIVKGHKKPIQLICFHEKFLLL